MIMKRHVLLVVAIVAMLGIAGCTNPLSSGTDDPAEYVPSDSNAIVHMDMAVAQDSDTRTLLDAFAANEGGSDVEDTEDAMSEFKNETGLDPNGVSEVTFYTIPNDDDIEEYGSTADYMGFVVYSDWSEDEFIDAVESEESYDFTTVERGDVTVYEPDVGDDYYGHPISVAVVGDGTYAMGDEKAVDASVAVANGNDDSVSGDLKDGFDEMNDGHITFAYEVAPGDVPSQAPNQELDTSAFEDVSVVAGSYDTNSGTVTFESQMYVSSEDSATDVADVTDGGLSMVRGTATNDDVKDELRNVEVTQDGDVVTVTYEGSVDTLAELIEEYMTQPGSVY